MIDFQKEKVRRSNDPKDWTVRAAIEDVHNRLTGDEPSYLKDADAVVIVFVKRYPDGSSQETIIQAGTVSGNEAIGILTSGIAVLTRPE